MDRSIHEHFRMFIKLTLVTGNDAGDSISVSSAISLLPALGYQEV